jgi:mono/diheme cytochrome c family protein
MTKLLRGEVKAKPRPWLLARMPAFTAVAETLPAGLAHAHGLPLRDEPTKIDPERAKLGEQLFGENGGFNCLQCHAFGDRQATAVFEAPGPDFAHVKERIRRGYYMRWVLHPLRIDPETKMPKFADDEGKTPLTDILGGRAEDQFDAIWQFLVK